MPPDDLVSVADIARLLGVSPATAARYADREDFPAPVNRTSGGRVWRREEVLAWGKATLPLRTGRPRRIDGS
jgi:predicted DNA-binding transcriptional regulator AlpA